MKMIDRDALVAELWICAPSCEIGDDDSMAFRSGYDLAQKIVKNFGNEERHTRQEIAQEILESTPVSDNETGNHILTDIMYGRKTNENN